MDLSKLSKETLISIINDQKNLLDQYETKQKTTREKTTREKTPEETDTCKCRIWSGFPHKQCSRKGIIDGYCKIHNDHRVKWGKWHLCEIDGPKPEYWGEFCEYVPCGEKRGNKLRR